MTKHLIFLAIIGLFYLSGCEHHSSTSICTIDNSGRELAGTLLIDNQKITYADCLVHSGNRALVGGELVRIDVTDIWTEVSYSVTATVPPTPQSSQSNLLNIYLTKEMKIVLNWDDSQMDFDDLKAAYILKEFNAIPIIIEVRGSRTDFIARTIQGNWVRICSKMEGASNSQTLYYGFVHKEDKSVSSIVAISYVGQPLMNTILAKIPSDFLKRTPETSALYLAINQDSSTALLYALSDTSSNPRLLIHSLRNGSIELPKQSLDIELRKTSREVTRHNIRLPDPDEVRS
jgi:hypothetical protein